MVEVVRIVLVEKFANNSLFSTHPETCKRMASNKEWELTQKMFMQDLIKSVVEM